MMKRTTLHRSPGQAMVESMLIIVFVTMALFAAVQLCTVVVNDLISNEAAFAVNRAVIVSSDKRVNAGSVGLKAALYVLARQSNINNLIFVPYGIETKKRLIYEAAPGGTNVYAYITYVKYASSIVFASFLQPSETYTVGNIHLLKNTARAEMVHPPDEDYYYKAYPDAPEF